VFLTGYGFYADEFVVIGGLSSQFLKADGSIDTNVVPYTGAIASVDLNTFNITANSFIKLGGLSTQFLKADGTIDSSTYLTTSAAASTYVPYTGATGDVDLGVYRLTSQSLRITTDDAEMIGISCFPGAQDFFK
jgi:hypothetical protein